ncbi:hypothetical protein NL676_009459 [Syzygium grande]|nr:hypothetical protein NL676_009459 [Syzygium grande]
MSTLPPKLSKEKGMGVRLIGGLLAFSLHELLYGKTPFKGSGNGAHVIQRGWAATQVPGITSHKLCKRDLIHGLLVKEPQNRLGVKRGATEIKQHPFFEGVNWALIRCSTPPEVPRPVEAELRGKYGAVDPVGVGSASKRMSGPGTDMKSGGKFLDFEFF